MNLLAIDTSAGCCSVAACCDGRIVEHSERMERGHAEALLPMLLAALREAGCGFTDLAAVAVTVGPGAFTGLRVGLATARGLALAAKLPCLGVSTFEAIAESVDAETTAVRPLLVALDTKRGDVYLQAFAAGQAVGTADVVTPAAIAARYAGQAVAVAGDVSPAVAAALRAAGADPMVLADSQFPAARHVAAVAARRWQAGERPTAPPAPVYLRAPATGPQVARP